MRTPHLNFIQHRKRWVLISVALIIASAALIGIKGLNLSVEFTGGSVVSLTNSQCTVEQARDALAGELPPGSNLTIDGKATLRVQTPVTESATTKAFSDALISTCGGEYSVADTQVIGSTWGGEITRAAILGLAIFLVLAIAFLSIYYQWRMALAAILALVHDIIITLGFYSLTGLPFTPATVIGLLTILGYSLYDTVVVFDRIKQDAMEDPSRKTGSRNRNFIHQSLVAASLNRVFARSVHTTVTSILPVLAIIIVGAGFLGAGTLLDLAVALAVGMVVGAYSSLALGAPIFVMLQDAAQTSYSANQTSTRTPKKQVTAKT